MGSKPSRNGESHPPLLSSGRASSCGPACLWEARRSPTRGRPPTYSRGECARLAAHPGLMPGTGRPRETRSGEQPRLRRELVPLSAVLVRLPALRPGSARYGRPARALPRGSTRGERPARDLARDLPTARLVAAVNRQNYWCRLAAGWPRHPAGGRAAPRAAACSQRTGGTPRPSPHSA